MRSSLLRYASWSRLHRCLSLLQSGGSKAGTGVHARAACSAPGAAAVRAEAPASLLLAAPPLVLLPWPPALPSSGDRGGGGQLGGTEEQEKQVAEEVGRGRAAR